MLLQAGHDVRMDAQTRIFQGVGATVIALLRAGSRRQQGRQLS